MKNRHNVFKFALPHQTPGNAIPNTLEFLYLLHKSSNEESIAGIKTGGDKDMDKFFFIDEGKA